MALTLGVAAVGVRAAAGATLRNAGLGAGWAFGLAMLFALAALIVAATYRGHVRVTDVPTTMLDRLRQATVAVLFASAVLVPVALMLLHRPISGSGSTPYPGVTERGREIGAPGAPAAATRKPAAGRPFSFDLTSLLWILLGGLGVALTIFLIVFAISLLRKLPRTEPVAAAPPTDAADDDAALADALLAGRSALSGDDARAAIIACYAAMEASLGRAGVARERADSPSDLLRRARTRELPGTGAQDAVALTDLFREARYSTHPMSAQHLAAARRALDSVTAALAERIRASEAAATHAAAGTAPAPGSGVPAP